MSCQWFNALNGTYQVTIGWMWPEFTCVSLTLTLMFAHCWFHCGEEGGTQLKCFCGVDPDRLQKIHAFFSCISLNSLSLWETEACNVTYLTCVSMCSSLMQPCCSCVPWLTPCCCFSQIFPVVAGFRGILLWAAHRASNQQHFKERKGQVTSGCVQTGTPL